MLKTLDTYIGKSSQVKSSQVQVYSNTHKEGATGPQVARARKKKKRTEEIKGDPNLRLVIRR